MSTPRSTPIPMSMSDSAFVHMYMHRRVHTRRHVLCIAPNMCSFTYEYVDAYLSLRTFL